MSTYPLYVRFTATLKNDITNNVCGSTVPGACKEKKRSERIVLTNGKRQKEHSGDTHFHYSQITEAHRLALNVRCVTEGTDHNQAFECLEMFRFVLEVLPVKLCKTSETRGHNIINTLH
jgi:hypothetical protein